MNELELVKKELEKHRGFQRVKLQKCLDIQ